MKRPSQDLEKSVEELIDDLDKINADQTSATNPKANTIAVITALGKFSCLLAVLSKQTDIQTRIVIRLTWGLFYLTVILLIIAGVQLWIMFSEHLVKVQTCPLQ